MNSFYLGCDVSKGYADFVIIDAKKNIVEPNFQLDDTFDGHNRLYDILKDFFKEYPQSTLYAAVESTGGLENNWLNLFYRLADIMNIKAARVNPVAIKAHHKASMNRNDNDAISAQMIAEYLIAHPKKIAYNFDDPYTALRKQWSFVESLKKYKTQLLNQLSTLLYTSCPFLVKYCKNGVPNWLFQLLLKYPSANKMAHAREISISKIPYISHKRAKDIIAAAKCNIGSAVDEATSFLIISTIEQILGLKKTIAVQQNYMEEHCDLPEVELLTSFKGIGKLSAIGLVLNIISIERFSTAKHLASYFGIHPTYKQSGDGIWGFHMSKQGRAVPRKILFMVARNSMVNNPLIKEVYIEQLKRGKTKMSALGICMHKILRICYGMLKNNKEFDEEIDKRNKNKTRNKTGPSKSQKKETKRRFQKRDKDAPVSRRQSIKRKKRKLSQSPVKD